MLTGHREVRRSRRVLLVVAALLVLGAACSTAWASTRSHHLTARQRTVERKKLLRAVRRDPKVVTRPWFLKRAVFVGIDLPVTIRLTPATNRSGTPANLDDDAIQIDLGTDPTTFTPPGFAPGVVSSTLKGSILGSLRFGQDTSGYGQLGVVELGFSQIEMTGSGFDLVHDNAACALLKTDDPVTITEGLGSQGWVNFFGGQFSMDLHTQFSFASETRSTCGDPFTQTSLMDGTGRPPLPMRIDGAFSISPALTADGRLRLAKLTLSGTQHDSFVQVHTCTQGPPPPATCAANAPDEATLPGRLTTTSFNAEMIVGNAL